MARRVLAGIFPCRLLRRFFGRRQRKDHEISARPHRPYKSEPGQFECRNQSHEAIGRRRGRNRICLDVARAVRTCIIHGSFQELGGNAPVSEFPLDKKTNNRPDAGQVLVSAGLAIALSRSNRTPCNRLFAIISEDANRNSVMDPCVHGCLFAGLAGNAFPVLVAAP